MPCCCGDSSPDEDDRSTSSAGEEENSRRCMRPHCNDPRSSTVSDTIITSIGSGRTRVCINVDREEPRPRPRCRHRNQQPQHRIIRVNQLPMLGHRVGNTEISLALEYEIPYHVLVAMLPRVHNAIWDDAVDMRGFFSPELLRNNPQQQIFSACRHIFNFIECYNRTGETAFLYEATREVGSSSRDRRRERIHEWGACGLAICIALDKNEGLGCSEFLLGRVLRFMVWLVPLVENGVGSEQAATLVTHLLAVFESRGEETWGLMRAIWHSLGADVKDMVMETTYRRGRTSQRDHRWVLELDGR